MALTRARQQLVLLGNAEVWQLVEKLKRSKDKKLAVDFEYFGDEDHATILHQAVYNAFKWMNKAR